MNVKRIYLKSAEMFVGENAEEIFTTLGTCVAFCVFDKQKKIGGMIHYLLPHSIDSADPLNYAETAIPALFKELKNRGCKKSDLFVTIIGGNPVGSSEISNNIADANVQVALDWVKKLGLPHEYYPSRNDSGQQILFKLANGDLLVKKMTNKDHSEVESSESKESNLKINIKVNEPERIHRKIKVLIVDDSDPIRQILKKILGESNEIEVVGEAVDAQDAERLRIATRPDIMTLDIQMPNKDGVTYLSELMKATPLPVIMISDLSIKEVGPVMKALEIGAFDYIQKPSLRELADVAPRLINTIVAAFEGHKKIISMHQSRHHTRKSAFEFVEKVNGFDPRIKLIAIGASTGGTEALREVFRGFPEQTPPILVVQHMPKLFTGAFAGSLDHQSAISVKEAEHGEYLQNSTAYIAPGGIQMGVHDTASGLQIFLKDDPPVNRFKPSVDYLFNSLCELSLKSKINAALLTGMGEDGARGLLALRKNGSHTIAQNEQTCVVYGMPKAAVERNAAIEILPINEIAFALLHTGAKIHKKFA